MALTPEDRLILAGSKLHLSERDLRQIEELIPLVQDWNYFTENAIQNGVGPLLYMNIQLFPNPSIIPAEVSLKFSQTYYRILGWNSVLYEHFRKAVMLFSKEGIPVIALKGIYVAEAIYNDIALRQMSDIDLLLKEDDVKKCWNILRKNGYEVYEHKKTNLIQRFNEAKHLQPLMLNGVSIELHTKTFHAHKGYSVNMDDCWNRSQQVIINGVTVRKLCPEHQIQHSCIHLEEHFGAGKPQLYAFIDIIGIINKYSQEIDWNYFDEACRKYNCDTITYKYLFLLNKYFDVQFPDLIMQKAEANFDFKAEKLFLHYLQHFNKSLPIEITNRDYTELSRINGVKNKLLYLVNDIFPSRKFMYSRYNIRNRIFLFWYYLIRIKTGILRLCIHLAKRISLKAKFI